MAAISELSDDLSAARTNECHASKRNWRIIVWPKSRFGCSTNNRLRKSQTSRRNAKASASRPLSSHSAAKPNQSCVCPIRSSAVFASAMSSSNTGATPHHSETRWPRTNELSPIRKRNCSGSVTLHPLHQVCRRRLGGGTLYHPPDRTMILYPLG